MANPKATTDTKKPAKRSKPWYANFQDDFAQALKHIDVFDQMRGKIPEATYATFQKESLAQFIFESNNLEREGLPLGETRALVIEGLDELPTLDIPASNILPWNIEYLKSNLPVNVQAIAALSRQQEALSEQYKRTEDSIKAGQVKFIAKHGSKTREAQTVAQHLLATLDTDMYVHQYSVAKAYIALYWLKQAAIRGAVKASTEDLEFIKEATAYVEKHFPDGSPPAEPGLLSEDKIKQLHEIMADGLIDPSLSLAGRYRNHPVTTGLDSHYPAASDVPRAMEKFIRQFQEYEQDNLNPIALAAWASTQFVLIHPFSDFNGRMSRMIANMVLRSRDIPFWIALRSNKKDRARYIYALNHYRRGKKESIAALIARQVNENFVELNKILDLSDYPMIDPAKSGRPFEGLANQELLSISLPTQTVGFGMKWREVVRKYEEKSPS